MQRLWIGTDLDVASNWIVLRMLHIRLIAQNLDPNAFAAQSVNLCLCLYSWRRHANIN